MHTLLTLDEQLFIFLNSLHTEWLDPIMVIITKTQTWIPLYFVLIYFIIKVYKKQSWIPLLGLIITIVATDQITSSIMKPFFARLRPSHEPSLASIIHLVNNEQGGLYGFASSHAANTFGVAMFVWLTLRPRYSWSWLLFVWAALMSYSRIYLGLHYPLDILAGALVGVCCAWACYRVLKGRLDRLL